MLWDSQITQKKSKRRESCNVEMSKKLLENNVNVAPGYRLCCQFVTEFDDKVNKPEIEDVDNEPIVINEELFVRK